MNERLGLQFLANLLEWTNDEATREYRWLRIMSRYKYDGYQDFVAGKRFVASLIIWLKQFASLQERRTAYAFVRTRLVYLGPAELNHLVRLTYPEFIRPSLATALATRLNTPEYLVWAHPDTAAAYTRLLRATLFFALSDGARIDVFRRANAGVITNEQVLVAPQIHDSKWASVLKKLRKEQTADARFEFVFLLDDFTASGATLIRFDEEEATWTGKLVRFWQDVKPHIDTHFTPDWTVVVHHYVASGDARANIEARNAAIKQEWGDESWFRDIKFSYGTVLAPGVKLSVTDDAAFLALADGYYDPSIQTKHTDVGGKSVARGFGDCALPVVLDHNTPNNSVALLWAESSGVNGVHAMRPLFRRRQRHV